MKHLLLTLTLVATVAYATPECDRYTKFVNYPTAELEQADRFNVILTNPDRLRDEEFIKTAARAAEYMKPWCDQSKLPSPRIGMSAKTATNWGKPTTINRTTTAKGTVEQWVYGDGNYLYFTNGRLTAIQN